MPHLGSVATIACLLCVSSAAVGADFCAVRVLVSGDGGIPTPGLVELRDDHGVTVQSSTAPKGVAEFCDFGFGPHSIAVGGSTCGAVVLPHIELRFGVTQTFRVYLNRCGGDSLPRGCSIYFRIGDGDHHPLAGVSIASNSIGGERTTADSHGRALVWVPSGTSESYSFSKVGYGTANFDYSCVKAGYFQRAIAMPALGQ
jgi:hypothetical protein